MTLKEIAKIKSDIDDKLKREGLNIIRNGLKEVFDKYPQIKAIRWNGWAPYFNDGEACIFALRNFYVNFNDVDNKKDFLDFEDDGYRDYGVISDSVEFENKQLMSDLKDLWNAFIDIEDFFLWQFQGEFEATAYRDEDEIKVTEAPEHD